VDPITLFHFATTVFQRQPDWESTMARDATDHVARTARQEDTKMSLFRKAGEKFEETKRSVMGEDEPGFVCRSCEKPVTENFEHCPHCGEPTVEPIE